MNIESDCDAAYSEKGNIEYTKENDIKLVAKLNPAVTQGFRKNVVEFEFNKDAGMQSAMAIFAVNLKRILRLMDGM